MLGLPPFSYNLRSLTVRWSSTLLTVIGIGSTVAVLAGILALQQGFAKLYTQGGREDIAIFLRPGANSEGESNFRRETTTIVKKECPGIALDTDGQPLASGEMFLAVRLRKFDGGETNIPIRGVEPQTFKIHGKQLRIVEGQPFTRGNDEIIIGKSLVGRLAGCKIGDSIKLNTTPFRVVGYFESDGPYKSEIWGDFDRMADALDQRGYSRIIAQLKDPKQIDVLKKKYDENKRVRAKILSEKTYLSSQTGAMSAILGLLGTILALIMGPAAVFTGMNTMFGAISARQREIGILVSIGFKPFKVFLSFVFESVLLGLLGGLFGCILVIPLNGISTGTTNFQTFTEVAFAFQVTPAVFIFAVVFSMILGLVGGLIPAYVAANSDPVEALRQR